MSSGGLKPLAPSLDTAYSPHGPPHLGRGHRSRTTERTATMQKIGFIGLGIMGAPMAANLIKAGHEVTGYARSSASTERLVQAGGKPASSVEEAVNGADVVITMLPDSPEVEEVVLGENGVLAYAGPDLLLIDMSTIAPETSVAVAEQAEKSGVRVLDAPVSGGEPGAIEGTLSIMVGGDEETFEQAS